MAESVEWAFVITGTSDEVILSILYYLIFLRSFYGDII